MSRSEEGWAQRVLPAPGGAPRRRRGIPFGAAMLALGVGAAVGLSAAASAQSPAPAAAGAEVAAAPADASSPWSAREPWRTDRFYFQTSVYTIHFDSDPDHVNTQWLLNMDYRLDEFWGGGQWLAGGAAFVNSFGQWSQYVYGGWLARPFETLQPLYFKITAGLLHGYKAPYDEKIPFNKYGVAPAIVPGVGYCYDRFCSELVFFGTAGAMLTIGFTMP
jgi:hypothetical protein